MRLLSLKFRDFIVSVCALLQIINCFSMFVNATNGEPYGADIGISTGIPILSCKLFSIEENRLILAQLCKFETAKLTDAKVRDTILIRYVQSCWKMHVIVKTVCKRSEELEAQFNAAIAFSDVGQILIYIHSQYSDDEIVKNVWKSNSNEYAGDLILKRDACQLVHSLSSLLFKQASYSRNFLELSCKPSTFIESREVLQLVVKKNSGDIPELLHDMVIGMPLSRFEKIKQWFEIAHYNKENQAIQKMLVAMNSLKECDVACLVWSIILEFHNNLRRYFWKIEREDAITEQLQMENNFVRHCCVFTVKTLFVIVLATVLIMSAITIALQVLGVSLNEIRDDISTAKVIIETDVPNLITKADAIASDVTAILAKLS